MEAGRQHTAGTHVGEDNVGDGVGLSLEGLAEGLVAGNEILEVENQKNIPRAVPREPEVRTLRIPPWGGLAILSRGGNKDMEEGDLSRGVRRETRGGGGAAVSEEEICRRGDFIDEEE